MEMKAERLTKRADEFTVGKEKRKTVKGPEKMPASSSSCNSGTKRRSTIAYLDVL